MGKARWTVGEADLIVEERLSREVTFELFITVSNVKRRQFMQKLRRRVFQEREGHNAKAPKWEQVSVLQKQNPPDNPQTQATTAQKGEN